MRFFLFLLLFASLACFVQAEESPRMLRMGLDTGLSYSTNPYSLTSDQIAGRNVGDMMAKIKPNLSFNWARSKFRFDVGGSANAGILFGLNDNKNRFLITGGVNSTVGYTTTEVLSFGVQGGFSASRDPGELFVGDWSNLTGTAGLSTTYKPGAGKIAITLQGDYRVQGFPNVTVNDKENAPTNLNNDLYGLGARISWKFLPKTALFAESHIGFFESNGFGAGKIKSNPFSVGGGVMGQITNTLSATASAGYSRVFGTDTAGTVPVNMKLSLDWKYDAHASLNATLTRDIAPTPIFMDQVSNGLVLAWNQQLFSKLSLSANSQVGVLQYGKVNFDQADLKGPQRVDIFVGAGIGLSYAFQEWLAVGVSGGGFWRFSNVGPQQILNSSGWVASGDGNNYQNLFNRYEANVFLRLSY